MARRASPAQMIAYWSRRMGLDPRATKAVALGEGGLVDRPGTQDIGDLAGGGSYGPFQLYTKGALPRNIARHPMEQRDDWAWSQEGIKYALSKQAGVAKGLKGEAAVNAIIRRFERPADPDKSVRNAIARLRGGLSVENDPSIPSSPVYGSDSSTGGVDGQRKALTQFLLGRARAHRTGEDAPSLLQFATSLRNSEGSINVQSGMSDDMRAGTNPSSTFGADVPPVIRAGLQAQRMGLSVRENPYFDPVDPVHTKGSHHYKVLGKYKGKPYGAALDISGDPGKEARFFKWVEANRVSLGLDDLFHDPMRYSYDQGRRWNKTIGGHGHVHASFRR